MLKINILSGVVIALLFTIGHTQAAEGAKQCPAIIGKISGRDKEIAKVAWKYFENNIQKSTGLVNAVNNYPSTTLWDTGSALAAFISAESLGLIDQKKFDQITKKLLETILDLDLFNGEAPNKVYHTETGEKVNYANKASEIGIGVSGLDLGRIASWLNILSCLHPQHKELATKVLESWSYCRLIDKGQMYGMAYDKAKNKVRVLQEGRLGYEQYAGKAFKQLGFDQHISSTYNNIFSTRAKVSGVDLVVDSRDAKKLGAHNYVVSESYAMDYFEHGMDDENKPLIEDIYKVQKIRWKETGKVTAVSEDNLDRKPYFVYSTIFSDGIPWAAITDRGDDMSALRSLSTKAALSMAYVYPDREYSKTLLRAIWTARNPKGGWYSGIYEDKSKGFNKATTANTNGVVLSIFLSKMYGPLNRVCTECKKGIKLSDKFLAYQNNKEQCLADLPALIALGKKKSAEKKIKIAQRKRQDGINKIWDVYGKVKFAESLRTQGKLKKAAKTIKGIKKAIWNLGTRYADEKKNFHGLMYPIDVVAGKWNAGKGKANALKIQNTLKEIAQRKQNEK